MNDCISYCILIALGACSCKICLFTASFTRSPGIVSHFVNNNSQSLSALSEPRASPGKLGGRTIICNLVANRDVAPFSYLVISSREHSKTFPAQLV
jgi:hypothetical protein